LNPNEWKKGFNRVAKAGKWVYENPEKVKKAVDVIEKFWLASKGKIK
jgi:hypothetical protein